MTKLPPLSKVCDLGGDEFEKLMNQLLLSLAHAKRFHYEPHGKSGAADDGVDGLAAKGGVPGFTGPVAFQFKWLTGNLSRGGNASQIRDSFNDAVRSGIPLRHYVVVTPEDVSTAQKQWLSNLSPSKSLKVHQWGHARILSLLRSQPDLLAQYYPHSVASQPDASARTRKRLKAYLDWLIRECSPLKLGSIDQGAARPGQKPVGLRDVYVDLDLTLQIPKKQSLAAHLKATVGKGKVHPDSIQERVQELRRVPALEATGHHSRLVLLGPAGSGKSTLVSHLAQNLAEAVLGKRKSLTRLGPWWKEGALPPVRVILREFAASLPASIQRGRGEHLWDFIKSETQRRGFAPGTSEALREVAATQGALFLLDGLDEARDSGTRDRILEAVQEFAETVGPRCRFLITARPYAWEQNPKGQVPWPTAYRLGEFDEKQITAFIQGWFRSVSEAGWIGKSEAKEKGDSLQHSVGRVDIGPLASNPLLLTLMATLTTNRYRLPDDRSDLYDEVVKLLMQRWAETSGADRGLLDALAIPGLTLDHIRESMQQLAFDAHQRHAGQEGVANIREGELVGNLRPLLESTANAELALEYIEKRAGLLLSDGPGPQERQFTFPHRTFQEFLAACWLAEQPDFCQRAADLARQNPAHWREVLAFAARQAKVGRGVPAADALIGGQEFDAWSRENAANESVWRTAVVAGEQLLEIGLASVNARPEHRAVRRRVGGWIAALLGDTKAPLPVTERAKAGIVLARLGDERPGVGVKDGWPDIDWIVIPPGPFVMGEGKEQHSCEVIRNPFAISRYPVTVSQFKAFEDAGGYTERRFWSPAGWKWRQSQKITGPEDYFPTFQTLNHPRVGLSWFEAQAFSHWLAEVTKLHVRLPSEAEWERAARHTEGREYPWGEAGKGLEDRCNVDQTGLGQTSAVGMFPKGLATCGVADMAGNVWEWTRSLWGRKWDNPEFKFPYLGGEVREDENAPSDVPRVLRGGSWSSPADNARCACRYGGGPVDRYWFIGFRLVASPFDSGRRPL
ncbi:MAG: SUMF1/EgtB/PvdO family nonheme iron enzyme [Verrucomicrobiales bacterium]|nr:SUMF1/EgtB/PvdO family nonheme iron enzyme [Verrucomicrobiales bacterium]